jgi:hypothetical protein
MANWYVSVTTGNDSNDATTIANACATLAKAAELVGDSGSAGDIIHIAPGTYRGGVDNNTEGKDGTVAAPIKWIGDVNSEVFTAVEPGIVRVTYSDENDIAAQASSQIQLIDVRNREHQHFYNLSLDGTNNGGSTGAYLAYGNNSTDGNRFYNCIFQGSNIGVRNAELIEHCAFIGLAYACYGCLNVNNSVFVGISLYPVFACPAVGIWSSSALGKFINNTIMGANIATNVQNSAGRGTFYNSLLVGNHIGHKGNSTTYTYATSSYLQGGNKLGQRGHVDIIHNGGGQYQGDSWQAADHENSDFILNLAPITLWSYSQIMDLSHNLKPSVLNTGLRGKGTSTYVLGNSGDAYVPTFLPQYDILGHPRNMGEPSASHNKAYASTRDIGCWEYSDVYITSSAAGQVTMSIEGEGQFAIPIAVASGSSVTASADIKLKTTNALASLLKPQFILRQRATEPSSSRTGMVGTYHYATGSYLELNTATSTAASDVYSNLTIKAGPMKRDTIVEAVLYSRTTGSASTSSISNIVIQ